MGLGVEIGKRLKGGDVSNPISSERCLASTASSILINFYLKLHDKGLVEQLEDLIWKCFPRVGGGGIYKNITFMFAHSSEKKKMNKIGLRVDAG